MLLARLLGWIREHNTFNIFLLEILAVFIGITGSLYVDKWRQQQEDYETLDRELRDLYYELSRRASVNAIAHTTNVDAIRSTILLTYGDWQELSDEELLEHFWNASFVYRVSLADVELSASNSTLSIPFNEFLALIEASLADLKRVTALTDKSVNEVYAESRQLLKSANIVPNASLEVGFRDEDLIEDIVELFEITGGVSTEFIADAHNIATVRAAIGDPHVQSQLRQMITLHKKFGLNVLTMIQHQRDVLEAIRRYAPDISVPFAEVGIAGDGTTFGWQTYLPMTQDADDPNVWRITLDLLDGSVKFQADRAWVVNWGSSVSEPGIGDSMFAFVGDVSAAFPMGTAMLNGSNIPVRAGRYDIIFNTESLEYSFEEVDADD